MLIYIICGAYIVFLFIFAAENEMWKDLSSLQPQKKMLKHILF
ncbi:hypothetical protein BACEGG_03280 [Bacteroides eggerthii DSM 20697]|nr:hypothetical protein BACEGG_03280 [Bacteroides eggerthii DSM 20697]